MSWRNLSTTCGCKLLGSQVVENGSTHACSEEWGWREGGVTLKLSLQLRDVDMGILVEDVVVVASEVI